MGKKIFTIEPWKLFCLMQAASIYINSTWTKIYVSEGSLREKPLIFCKNQQLSKTPWGEASIFNSMLWFTSPFKPSLALTLCILGNFSFFKISFLEKILLGTSSGCQTVWIQISPDILSGMVWVQNVCKVYQQTTLCLLLMTY